MLKKGEHTQLSNLKIGQRARVLGLHLDKPEVRRHIRYGNNKRNRNFN